MVGNILHITDLSFDEVIKKNPLVVVDFWAEWCMPCRMLAPVVEELANEYAGKILFGKVNVDENPRTAQRFKIYGIPTLVIIRNGEEVDRLVGYMPKHQIKASLKKHLK